MPFLRVWGEIGYSLLMVLHQFEIKQCVPYTYLLRDEGFAYEGISSRPDIQKIANDWSELVVCPNDIEIIHTARSFYNWSLERHKDVIPPIDWMTNPGNGQMPLSKKVLHNRLDVEVQKGQMKESELRTKIKSMAYEAQI